MIWHDEVIKAIVALAGSFAFFRLTLKQPRLTFFQSGFASCRITNPQGTPTIVWISQITIQNTGKAPARNVRVAHHFLPQHWQVIQAIPFIVEQVAGQDRIIRFDTIEPGMIVTISYLDVDHKRITTAHDHVRSEDGVVPQMPVQLQRVFSPAVNIALMIVMLLGCFTAVSWAYDLVLLVLRKGWLPLH